jgi:hypothetical protein
VEVPKVNNLRVDLLEESPDGELIHIELQAKNEKHFALRMAEYLFSIGHGYGRLPRQVVLYVGEPRLRMKSAIEGPDLSFRFHMVDIRDFDGERLLASDAMGDNVIALLTRLGSEPDTVRRILKRIAEGPAGERDEALTELLILAALRRLDADVKREAKKMPILNDIMEHSVFGPLIRQGRVEGQLALLTRQIEKRFGSIPPGIRKRIAALKPAQLERAGLRLLDADRIEDLFAR